MKSLLKILHRLDWVLGVGTLAYGLYEGSWLIVAAGVLGLGVAWANPTQRLMAKLSNRNTAAKRRAAASDSAAREAIAAVAASEEHSQAAEADTPAPALPSFLTQAHLVTYSSLHLHPSRHNRLRADSANLFVRAPSQASPGYH